MTKALLDEPTDEMIEAGDKILGEYWALPCAARIGAVRRIYTAMRSSAPQEPEQRKPEGCSCESYPHTCHPKAQEPVVDDDARLLQNALDDLKFGMDFAYEQGLHEFGYDPLEVVLDRLQAKAPELPVKLTPPFKLEETK